MTAAEPPAGLDAALKEEIRARYLAVRTRLPGFVQRRSQREMIAAVARALAEPSGVLAVEAPTGTGKSMAYLLAALPLALSRNRKLVIATATVALQEQLVERDIPAFLAASGLQADIVLAKGRQRYACTRNLHELTRKDADIPKGASTSARNQSLLPGLARLGPGKPNSLPSSSDCCRADSGTATWTVHQPRSKTTRAV